MLTHPGAREQQLKRARDDARAGQARVQPEETTARTASWNWKCRCAADRKLTGFQHYLNSIIDSMPSALVAVDEQLCVTQLEPEEANSFPAPA